MSKRFNKKQLSIIGAMTAILLIGSVFIIRGRSGKNDNANVRPTPRSAPVNTIPLDQRPYVELKPLSSRNDLQITIHEPPLETDMVEMTLEYDRNKGVLDAVLKTFVLNSFPFTETIFLGSRSAGGHITYHEDVIGGDVILKFDGGDEPYALKNPWRYDDLQTEYDQISTTDAMFQLTFEPAWRTNKILIMQSPGLPTPLDGEVIAGPYLIRGVGKLPSLEASITARVSGSDTATLYGYDGSQWLEIESTLQDRTLSATTPMYELFVITK